MKAMRNRLRCTTRFRIFVRVAQLSATQPGTGRFKQKHLLQEHGEALGRDSVTSL